MSSIVLRLAAGFRAMAQMGVELPHPGPEMRIGAEIGDFIRRKREITNLENQASVPWRAPTQFAGAHTK
jgi:hypothetical protein